MAKKNLTEDVKRFIVKSLAVYESPSEIVLSVKEKYNKTVTRQNVHAYDPTKVAGEDLSDELKKLFIDTRTQFEQTEILPMSKKLVRIKKLSRFAENFENLGNDLAAAQIIEQIAKEEGGMFTNRREIDLKNVSNLSDEELLAIVNSKG